VRSRFGKDVQFPLYGTVIRTTQNAAIDNQIAKRYKKYTKQNCNNVTRVFHCSPDWEASVNQSSTNPELIAKMVIVDSGPTMPHSLQSSIWNDGEFRTQKTKLDSKQQLLDWLSEHIQFDCVYVKQGHAPGILDMWNRGKVTRRAAAVWG